MSESWKNRLWSLLLVCTFAVVLSVCNKAVNSTSDGSSSSGTAFADGSTVTISSLPDISVASAPLPNISATMICSRINPGVNYIYYDCDASDETTLSTIGSYNYAITHDDAFNAGWKLIGQACSYGGTAYTCALFHK